MLNNFYIRCFWTAYRNCKNESINILPISHFKREEIILEAVDKLSEKEKTFITMLNPLFLEDDPNGVVSLKCERELSNAFSMNKTKRKNFKNQIRAKIIRNISDILKANFQ